MNIPKTDLLWTDLVKGEEYKNIIGAVANRPIVAWFSKKKRCVHTLVKVTARLGDDLWIIVGHNHDGEFETNVLISPVPLNKALRYLTKKNGWVLCEFPKGADFHKAVISYLA